jgi:uncharacterized delta-60 repeat protein
MRMRGFIAVTLAALVAVPVAFAHGGDTDLGFGVGGQVLTSLGATNDQLNEVLIDGKGRIVAAGQIEVGGHNQLAAARYKPSGALDPSFGSGGVVQQPVGTDSFGAAVARDRKGRILVAGASDGHVIVARFRSADGTPDTSFGTGGVVTEPTGFQDAATDVNVDSHGRIVVVGQVQLGFGQPFDALVLRFLPSGDLDDSFGGGDGIVTEHFGDQLRSTFAPDVALDGKGRIVVAVNATREDSITVMGAMRLRPRGALDTTFGKGGKRLTAISTLNATAAQGLALDGRGRIVLGGFSNFKFALVRYTPDGSLDQSFSSDGIVTTSPSPDGSQANSLAIDPKGRIVAAGQARVNGGFSDVAVVRYLPSGRPDPNFGSRGIVVSFVGEDNAVANGVATDAKSRIVIVGLARSGTAPNDSLLVRYIGD